MRVVHGYIHHNGSVGVIAQFECGTDFTARTPEFKEVMTNICMSLAMFEMDNDPYLDIDSDDAKCVHDDSLTIPAYLEQATKLFKEPIKLLAWNTCRHDIDYTDEDEETDY